MEIVVWVGSLSFEWGKIDGVCGVGGEFGF